MKLAAVRPTTTPKASGSGAAPTAAPSIHAVVPPSVRQGATLIISGSFGGSGPSVLLFDNFENGEAGARVQIGANSTASVGAWQADHEGRTDEPPYPLFSDQLAVSGNLSWQVSAVNGSRPVGSPLFPNGTRDVFLSYWVTVPAGNQYPGEGTTDGDNWKIVWLLGDGLCHSECCDDCSGSCYGCQGVHFDDVVVPVRLKTGQLIACNGCMNYDKYFDTVWTPGQWKRFSVWVQGGTGDHDGALQLHELSASSGAGAGTQQLRVNSSGVNILHPQGAYSSLNLNGYTRDTPECHPTFDDVYIATGPSAAARVELGDAEEYADCTHLAVLTVTSWTAAEVKCTAHSVGQLVSLKRAFVFVVDEMGQVSEGFPVVITRTQLKTDDEAPPPSAIGEHRDDAWWTCMQTCKNASGKPTPELCSPLNPQPNHSWEVVAPQVGGNIDGFSYGANGTEWRQWMQPHISGGKVTTMPTFNARQDGFSAGINAGFLCEAHRQGIRVVDTDTIDGIYSPYSLMSNDIFNDTAMIIWAEAAAHFMVSAGIDGFSLDLEVRTSVRFSRLLVHLTSESHHRTLQ